ncbi:hypothetical protein DAI22_02g150500 [Oryza sativa Japonica Group]|nr:hypothetical protein DAI22_02g150500 [Oryza sativa Japonica Group]
MEKPRTVFHEEGEDDVTMATTDATIAHIMDEQEGIEIKYSKCWNPIRPPTTLLTSNGHRICIRPPFSAPSPTHPPAQVCLCSLTSSPSLLQPSLLPLLPCLSQQADTPPATCSAKCRVGRGWRTGSPSHRAVPRRSSLRAPHRAPAPSRTVPRSVPRRALTVPLPTQPWVDDGLQAEGPARRPPSCTVLLAHQAPPKSLPQTPRTQCEWFTPNEKTESTPNWRASSQRSLSCKPPSCSDVDTRGPHYRRPSHPPPTRASGKPCDRWSLRRLPGRRPRERRYSSSTPCILALHRPQTSVRVSCVHAASLAPPLHCVDDDTRARAAAVQPMDARHITLPPLCRSFS